MSLTFEVPEFIVLTKINWLTEGGLILEVLYMEKYMFRYLEWTRDYKLQIIDYNTSVYYKYYNNYKGVKYIYINIKYIKFYLSEAYLGPCERSAMGFIGSYLSKRLHPRYLKGSQVWLIFNTDNHNQFT